MSNCKEWLKRHAPDLIFDEYHFKDQVLNTAEIGWSKSGVKGMVCALYEHGYHDVVESLIERMAKENEALRENIAYLRPDR